MVSSIETVLNGELSLTKTNDLSASLIYLQPDEKHKVEKPYKLYFNPGEGLPRTNTVNKQYGPISFCDIRTSSKALTFEENGICVLNMNTKLRAEDFYSEDRVKSVYYDELRDLLIHTFKAVRVEFLEHLIRKRHTAFPVSTGKDYDHLQPTSVVHTDFTLKSALEASHDILKVENKNYRRIQCINIWKPLRGPLTDWPLGVCDEATADVENDYIASDVVSRTGFTENYLIYFNPNHKWYYLSRQIPTELVLFRQADTNYTSLKGVPHTGFQNSNSDPSEVPRESIETRAFLYYE